MESKQQKQSALVILGNALIDGKKCSGAVDIPDEVKVIGDGAFERARDSIEIQVGP